MKEGLFKARISLALLHTPVYDKHRQVVTTSINSLDLHDIARCATTYGVKKFFVVNPLRRQKELIRRIIHHWDQGFGSEYNPNRKEALSCLEVRDCLEDVLETLKDEWGEPPLIISTDAKEFPSCIGYHRARRIIEEASGPCLLLFGTGWGATEEILDSSDYILEPIKGRTDYNHLSVRSAVAIILDRLLSENGNNMEKGQ